MKKIFSIIFITIFAFTLTGCENKELEVICTIETGLQDVSKENKTLTIYYQGKNPTKVIDERIATFLNPDIEFQEGKYINIYYEDTSDFAKNWNSSNAISGNVTKDDNNITTKIIFDIPNITDTDDLEKLKQYYSLTKPKDFVEEYKNKGFTCTTK